MRLDPKSAGAFAFGAFFFLLIFGVGWPGPGAWLLVFALLFMAAGAAAWWLDAAAVPVGATGAFAGVGSGTPFGTAHRAQRGGAPRGGDSLLLALGLPGPDASGRWVLPDRVHVTLVAGAVGVLALIIFVGGALSGGAPAAPQAVRAVQPNPVIDLAQPITPGQSTAAPLTGATQNAVPAPATDGSATATATGIPAPGPLTLNTPTTTRPAPARPLEATNAPAEPAATVVYEVQDGDTIYDLAIQYNTSIEAIMNANGVGEHDTIRIGDRLLIPTGTDQ